VIGREFAEGKPGEQEEEGAAKDHPDDAEGIGAQKIDWSGAAGIAFAEEAVIPSCEGVDHDEEGHVEKGEYRTVEQIAPAGPEVVEEEDVDEGEENEEVVDPEDPVAKLGGAHPNGGGQEGPNVEAGPEVEDALKQAKAAEDGEGAKDVGDIAKVDGEAGFESEAHRDGPVDGIEGPDHEAAPPDHETEAPTILLA
jgi:hypothetical protein